MDIRRQSWIIFLLSILSTGVFNGYNWGVIHTDLAENLRSGVSIRTQDDASYLVPAENFLEKGEWRSNAVGNSGKYTRPPGYGLVYLIFRSFLSQASALIALIFIQIIVFGIAAALLPKLGDYIGLDSKLAFGLGLVVALMPTFSGFLTYTLTEGLVPSLVLIFLFLVFRSYRNPSFSIFWSALLLALILIVRPAMLVWLVVFIVLGISKNPVYGWSKLLVCLIVAVSPLLVWMSNAALNTGEPLTAHPIYHSDSNGLYRPIHKDIWGFHKMWGQAGVVFHNKINGLWEAALADEQGSYAVYEMVESIPHDVKLAVGEPALIEAYTKYFKQLQSQAGSFHKGQTLPGESPLELGLRNDFRKFQSAYLKENPVGVLFVVPFHVYWKLAAHSNLNLYIFQKHWRGSWLMECLRGLSYALHLALFLFFPFAFFYSKSSKVVLVLGLPVLLYLGYLCFVQRGVEERYTLPMLIPTLLVLAYAIQLSWKRIGLEKFL